MSRRTAASGELSRNHSNTARRGLISSNMVTACAIPTLHLPLSRRTLKMEEREPARRRTNTSIQDRK